MNYPNMRRRGLISSLLFLSSTGFIACSSNDAPYADNVSISLAGGATSVITESAATTNPSGYDPFITVKYSEFGLVPTTSASLGAGYDAVKKRFTKMINISFPGTAAGDYTATNANLDYEDDTSGLLVLDKSSNSGTSLALSISQYGGVGGVITGTYSGKLCMDLAFRAGKCKATDTVNLVAVSGGFSITREADELYVAQGTAAAPMSLGATPIDTANGTAIYTVKNALNSYYSADVVAGKIYAVELNGFSNGVDLNVYSDAGMTTALCSHVTGAGSPISCITGAVASGVSKLYVKVGNHNAQKSGDDYSIVIQDSGPYAQQGSKATPITMTAATGQTGLTCDVAVGKCYYVVNGLTAGSTYTVSMDKSSEFYTKLTVFGDAAFGTKLCNLSKEVRSCAAKPTTSSLYLEVRTAGGYDITYDISVAVGGAAYTDEGTKTAPIAITGTSHIGTVGIGRSYYSVKTTANTHNIITLSNASETGLRVSAYDDSTLAFRLCRIDSAGSCTILTSGATATTLLEIDGSKTTSGAASFTLDIASTTSGGYRNDGDAATPTSLTLATDKASSVGYEKNGSFYVVGGLTAGSAYTVAMSNPSNQDINFGVYDNSTFTTLLCNSGFDSMVKRSCAAKPSGASLYVKVLDNRGISNNGGSYTLNVSAGGTTYVAEAVSLTLAQATNRASTVSIGSSVYTITGLTNGTSYTATISAMDGDVDILSIGNGASTQNCTTQSGALDETCSLSAAVAGTLTITVDGSKTASGSGFTLNVR